MHQESRPSTGHLPVRLSPSRLDNLHTRPPSHRNEPSPASISDRDASMLSAPSANKRPLAPFGRNEETAKPRGKNGSLDFLPSVSFDDLHSSIESASADLKLTEFPNPTGQGSILEAHGMADQKMPDPASTTQRGGSTRAAAPPVSSRTGRSGSIVRRASTSSRQPSSSSIASSSSGPLDVSTGLSATRTRRQSHYPPVSSTSIAKPPRKSIGPGVVAESDTGRRDSQRRRPSLRGERGGGGVTRTSVDGFSTVATDNTANLHNNRHAKARSVQPPPRVSLAPSDTMTPEHNRLSTLAPRSPRLGGQSGTPSSASKRASVMPGNQHASHATGLGARTISPTDTRRMKRMSTMPQSQSLNHLAHVPPPPPVSLDTRADSRSPSMIPRKTSITPSSARTTPDMNRKSYSSGLSVGSATSYNTVRTSTGSLQPRFPQSASTSRLPAPKLTSNGQNSGAADDEEDVPPVPAIPKAYESPKDTSATDNYFAERKKTGRNGPDATSIHSTLTGDISMPVLPEPTKIQRKPSTRKSSYGFSTKLDADGADTSFQSRKQLQPLSLPPLNLGPLNIPTTGKPSKSRDELYAQRDMSPPLSRQIPKTPSTPLTASKSAFFSKGAFDDTIEMPSLRSSSSVHHIRRLTPTPPEVSSSDSSLVLREPDHKPSLSPYLSSSVPKTGFFEQSYQQRSKTGFEHESPNTTHFDQRPHPKPAGPRAPNVERTVPKSPPPEPIPEQPQTPSSMTSLRRKLSLTWKRGSSKGSLGAANDVVDKSATTQPAKPDNMPPPRIPVSATVNSLASLKQNSPTPAVKQPSAGYLESRRRKSSAASLSSSSNNGATHGRTKSDNWKKDGNEPTASTQSSRNPSVMNKILKSRSSSSTFRNADTWTADLDKDDLAAEDEMRKLGSRRKDTEQAAKNIDALRKRASPKERVGAHEAIRIAMLNIYERGEIVEYSDVYFCGTQNARKVVGDLQSDAPNFGYDDERGDYTIVTGDHLSYRYEIVDVLGKGSFGQVVRCIDHKLGVLVAIKIIRNKKRFHQQALVEVNILQKLREWDPKNKHSMVNFTQSFYFRGHLCISTELLDMNLYELIKAHSFRGFSLRIVRRFTKQILSSLNLLKQHRVIHCDLKPENILLRHPLHSELKVIDFGSSCFENEKVYTYIQSRFYRSPEVILGMTYGLPIDMWSVGCILAELYTGVPIFPGENEQEQLACIMEIFGPPEKHLIEKSTRKKLFFDSMGKPRLTVSSKGRRRRPSSKTLQQALKCDDEAFLDFLTRCLRWDPDRRMRPEDAIRHEFITGRKMSSVPIRETSPVKRHNTISMGRPLPEPPGATKGPPVSARNGPSPHKPTASGSRRVSGVTAPTAASVSKRASAGGSGPTISASASGLPRASGRSASGKQDVAAAGANAAMTRRM